MAEAEDAGETRPIADLRKTLDEWPVLVPVAAAYLLVYVSWQVIGWGGEGNRELIGDLAIIPPTALAALACWGAAGRSAGAPRLVWGWRLVALAIWAYVGGEVAQLIYGLGSSGYAFPSLADPLYLAFFPLFLAAIFLFTSGRRGTRSLRTGLDAATIAIGGAAVAWYVALGPTASSDTGDALSTVVSVAYPVGDIVVIFALAHLLADPTRTDQRLPFGMFAAAATLFVVADMLYGRLVLEGSYAGGNVIDTLYVVALLLFALAGASQRPTGGEAGEGGEPLLRRRHLAVVPYLAVATVFALLIVVHSSDAFFPGLSLVIAAVLAAALVALRQALAQRDLARVHAELRAAHAELAELAVTDSTTGLPNQRALAAAIDAELERGRGGGPPCALLFLDIDRFKSLNDSFGHAAGDLALREFGEVVSGALRAVDSFGRWGGEEFVALLPALAGADAPLTAERVRAAVAGHRFAATDGRPLTVSIGVALAPEHGSTREQLLAAADGALYDAKRRGRDRVCLAGPERRSAPAPL